MNQQFTLSETEIQQTTQFLSKLEPGFLPHSLFIEIYRLTPAPILQIIPFRRNNKKELEVMLVQRPADDPLWPLLWHNPGTAFRATDTLESAANRLFQTDLGGLGRLTDLVFVKNLFHHSDRGSEIIQLYWLEISEEVPENRFFPVDRLPEDIIESEITPIRAAQTHYSQSASNKPPTSHH